MSANPNRVTQEELARLLVCRIENAYDVADRKGIPYDERESVRANGNTYTRRVYLRAEVLSALDESGRHSVRRGAA